MNTELNIEELKDFLGHIISNNKHLQEVNKMPVAVNVTGVAGIGKTSVMIELAKEMNGEFIKLSLSAFEELGDLIGFPLKEFEVCKEGGSCKWVPETLLPMYIQSHFKPTGQKRMSHAIPEWIQGKGENGILLLDDYTRAQPRFIQATMELIDRQEYGSWKLPKGWTILLSTNPDNGEYFVTSLDGAQKTRMLNVDLKFDEKVWAKWAENNEIDTRGINFVLMHPELVTGDINARSITTFFNSITSIKDFEKTLPLIQLIGEGSVGPEFSTMFTMFINNKLDKLIHPREILTADNWETVAKKLEETIGKANSSEYRADIAGVIANRIINYTIYYSSKEQVTQKIIDRIIDITTAEELFTTDLRYYIIKVILNSDKSKFQKLMMNSKIVAMAIQ
jgi:DNA polymerase III delta prime subunit